MMSLAAIVGSFVLAAVIFILVEGNGVGSRTARRVAAIIVGGDAVTAAGGGGSGRDSQTGRGGAQSGNTGRGGAGNLPRFLFSVVAPQDAAILVNGVPVGKGNWETDTLAPGNYRVSAQLVVASDCKWGRDSTLVTFVANGPATARLFPRACGNMSLRVIRDNQLFDAEFTVLDSGGVIRVGRVPMTAPVVVPTGMLRLTVSAPTCLTYQDSILIVADSVSKRTIPISCGAPLR